MADYAYDDVHEHGDEPVTTDGRWAIFDQYPRTTWRQDAVWRRQAARAFDDLWSDLEGGNWPFPTCPAEEMALHLIVQMAEAAASEDLSPFGRTLDELPRHPDDTNWALAIDSLFQDTDILELFNMALDGIEDPGTEINQQFGIGDYRSVSWFKVFNNVEPRDPRRPFRR